MNLNKYIIKENNTILEALIAIDKNGKNFLIVLNDKNMVTSVLTDGDIRRILIKGNSINTLIKDFKKEKFTYVLDTDSINKVIELFKNESIKFVPILDSNSNLKNVITKNQLHSLLLQDIHVDLSYEFEGLNENQLDYEIYPKPWGFYKTTILNNTFQSKILNIKPKKRLSLQSHKQRDEYWTITNGEGLLQLDSNLKTVKSGDFISIPKGTKHRITNTSESKSLIITEVQLGSYFGEDDITRYDDDYGR